MDNEQLEDTEEKIGFGGNVIDDEPDGDVDPDREAAETLENVLSDLQALYADRSTSTRGRALAITKLQEALFWLGQDD